MSHIGISGRDLELGHEVTCPVSRDTGSGLAEEGALLLFSVLPHIFFLSSFPPAFGYGLLCLGMAYISSQLGPVLQVMTMEGRNQFLGEKWILKPEIGENSYCEGNDIGGGVRNCSLMDCL